MKEAHKALFRLTDMMYFPGHKFTVAIQVNTSVRQNLGWKGPARMKVARS